MNFRHRYKVLAGIAGIVSLAFFISMYKYSDSPETRVSGLEAERSGEERSSSKEPVTSLLPSDHSANDDDDSLSRQKVYAQKMRVSIDVDVRLILVDAVEATLHDVLDGLVDKALVTVVDLGPEDESIAEETQPEKLSFRFSGPIDDVLRFVMEKYKYSYAISYASSTDTPVETPVTRLFLYGTMQGGDTQLANDQRLSPAGAEAVPATGYSESGGGPGITPERSEKKPVNISEVLRNRALSTANPSVSSAGSSPGRKHSLSGDPSSAGSAPASDTSDDETMESRLADMTRRASEEVKALAAGLKEAERSLEAQRNNEYGNTEQ